MSDKIIQLGVVSLNINGSENYKLSELASLFEQELEDSKSKEVYFDDVDVNIQVEPELNKSKLDGSHNIILSFSGTVKDTGAENG